MTNVCSRCGATLKTEMRYMPKAKKPVSVTVCKRVTCRMYRAIQTGVKPG